MAYTKKHKSGRKSKKTPKLAKSTARAVKQIVRKQMSAVIESKVSDYSTEPVPALAYYHNTPYIHDTDMFFMSQGVRDELLNTPQNRIGDSIYVKNIQLSLMITNFSTRPNLCYRITILKVKDISVSLNNPYGHPQCGNSIMAPINTEATGLLAVVYDKTFTSLAFQTANGGDQDKKFIWRHNIKVNKKITYDNSSLTASRFTYRLYVTCYDTQATLIASNVARFTYMRRTHFLDA